MPRRETRRHDPRGAGSALNHISPAGRRLARDDLRHDSTGVIADAFSIANRVKKMPGGKWQTARQVFCP